MSFPTPEFDPSIPPARSVDASKKVPAGILGILLGAFGVHKFVLGYTKEGLIMLLATIVISVVTCGVGFFIVGPIMGLIGLIEGIIYLTKNDDEFVRTYVNAKRGWF